MERARSREDAVRVALDRLDAIRAELAGLRAVLVEALGTEVAEDTIEDGAHPDDFRPDALIDVPAAAERFFRTADCIRLWCRARGLGIKIDGTWWASVPRIERHMAKRRE